MYAVDSSPKLGCDYERFGLTNMSVIHLKMNRTWYIGEWFSIFIYIKKSWIIES